MPRAPRRDDVVVQRAARCAQVGLVDQVADGADIVAAERQDLRVVGDEVQVDRAMAAHELLRGLRLDPALLMARQELGAHVDDDGAEDLVLVLEVVVEGARGEIGAAHDVAHAGRAVADLGEHRARRLEQRRAVLRLVLFAPARPLALLRRVRPLRPCSSSHSHRPSCASSWRSPVTMSSIARAAACNAPRMPIKPWISDSNSRWIVFTPAAASRSA